MFIVKYIEHKLNINKLVDHKLFILLLLPIKYKVFFIQLNLHKSISNSTPTTLCSIYLAYNFTSILILLCHQYPSF